MKISLFSLSTLCLALLCAPVQAEPVNQKVLLREATVFLRGAQLSSTATVNLPAGESEVSLINVAGNINEQSLSISADSGVVVQSSTVRNNFLAEDTLSPQAASIKQQLEAAQAEQNRLKVQQQVLAEQLEVLAANRRLGGDNQATSVMQVTQMLDLVDKRMTSALNAQASLQVKIKAQDEQIQKLTRQLAEEKSKGFQPGGQILVKFYTTKATSSNLTISYVVPQAGWVPSYDLQIDKVGAPVKLTYKAQIFQNSGINWDKTHLILSTGNPSQGAQAPTLRPWYVSVYEKNPVPTGMMERAAPVMEMAAPAAAKKSSESSSPRQQALDGYVTTNTHGINTEFDISLPSTVPSDGKGHVVMIKSTTLPASYRYVAIPKLDRDAFLQAQITGWEALNLLPGASNIFFEGAFVGQGRIDIANTKETMDISLGRDKSIVVTRENPKNFKSKPEFFGSTTRQQFAYNISVKNTRKQPITLVVFDQTPVSSDSDVQIKDMKIDDAKYDAATGKLEWTLELNAGQAKDVPFSYTVSYPKDKQVSGL